MRTSVAYPESSQSKRLVFWIALTLIAVGLIGFLELSLRFGGVRVSDDPYLQFGSVSAFFEEETINGRTYCVAANSEMYPERKIKFLRQKTENTFRVFCLGGSASAGWPHPQSEIYSVYLQESLQRAFPNRSIEVLNVSAHAYAAYRVRLIFQEVIRFNPDLIILYSGNNEFLEKRLYGDNPPWDTSLTNLANKFVLFRLIRGSPVCRYFFPENTLHSKRRESAAYAEWSWIEQLALDLRKDSRQFQRVRDHYAFSVNSIVRDAEERGIPTVLLTVPVNLRDWQPNVSFTSLEAEKLEQWKSAYRNGRRALLLGKADSATIAFHKSVLLEPNYADAYFYLGRAFEVEGKFKEAYENYSIARDFDYNPFRAISDFNQILKDIPQHYKSVHLVDAEKAFRVASMNQLPGFDLFLDYVHPTKRGNLILAESVFDEIIRQKLVGTSPAISKFTYQPRPYYPDLRPYSDSLDFQMHSGLVALFAMMHQYESTIKKARWLYETLGAFPTLQKRFATIITESLEVFPPLVESERKEILGDNTDPPERKRLREELKGFYRRNFPGYEVFAQLSAK